MANQKITIDIGANITDFQNKIKTLGDEAKKLDIGKGITNNIERALKKYEKVGELINQQPSESGYKALNKEINESLGLFGQIEDKLKDIQKTIDSGDGITLLSKEQQNRISQAYDLTKKFFSDNKNKTFVDQGEITKLQKLQDTLNDYQKQKDNNKSELSRAKATADLVKTYDKYLQQKKQIVELEEKENRTSEENRKLGQLKGKNGIQKTSQQLQSLYTQAGQKGNFFRQGTDTVNANPLKFLEENKNAQQSLDELKKTEKELEQQVKDTNTQIQEQINKIAELAKTGYTNKMKSLGFTDEEKLTESADSAVEIVSNEEKQQLDDFANSVNNLNKETKELSDGARQNAEIAQGNAQALKEENQAAAQVDGFKARLQSIFSLSSATLMLRRGIQNAINTIKELDATMTEAAVVTDFTVSDMWDQLPEYTKRASELGVAINDAYKAATLFYQQGLNAQQVIALSNSTLKMARIAGLDASEATDRMTNALRGFNMALNETNADNVADVYSKLAAITASNVDEISTAMTKVASLANSANMSFENTAAFLSQIIETTRESAETAGTALKTVVARFAEIKTNPGEIADIDGETASYNNIDKALQSVGISLDKFMKGEEGLDQVLMRLAEKWDTLSTTTQRYIATQAAGSRQQSRFIALMSDYARTQELVSAANNAAGASSEQYEKTLDSLETKWNKLKNAWDTFTMGIANSDFIKGALDLATNFVNALNKINEGADGLWGSITRLGTAFLVFQSGKTIVNGLIKSFTGLNINTKKTEGIFDLLSASMKDFHKASDKAGSALNLLYDLALDDSIKNISDLINGKFKNALTNGSELLEVFGMAAGKLAPLLSHLGIAIAAVGVAVLAGVAIYKSSAKGQLEDAKKRLKSITDECNKASEAFNGLADSFKNFKDEENEIAALAVGTSEWTAKVLEHNQAVLELAESYDKLNEVQYNEYGVASLSDNSQNDILNQAKSDYVQKLSLQNSAQNKVNSLQVQVDINKAWKENKNALENATSGIPKELVKLLGKSLFQDLISEIQQNGGIANEDIINKYKNTYGYSDEIIHSAEEVALNISENNEALFKNTKSLVTLNNTLSEGEKQPTGYNEAYKDSYETLKAQELDIGLDEYLNQKYIEYYNEQLPLFQRSQPSNEAAALIGVGTAIQAQFNNIKDSLIAEYNDRNSKLTQEDINKYNQEIQTMFGNSKLEDSIKNDIFVATQNIKNGRQNNFGLLELDENSFNNLKIDKLKNGQEDNVKSAFDQLNDAGGKASKIKSSVLSIDDISDTIWTKLYQGFVKGGKDYNFDLENYSVRELSTLQKVLEEYSEEQYGGLKDAVNETVSALIEANQNKTYDDYKSQSYAMIGDLATGDIENQADFYESAAKAITGFKGDLIDANGEIQDSATATLNLAVQLERAALYGEDLAKACIDYSEALNEEDIKKQNQALSDMVGYLSGITGMKITSDMILEEGATEYIKNATNSIQDYAKMLDYFSAQAIQNSTDLTREQKVALVDLQGGYASTYGTIVSNQKIIDSFNESILQGTLTLEQLGKILGQQYDLKVTTNEEGKEILQYIQAIGNNSSLTSTFNTIKKSITYWENPLEKHYQLLKDINKQQRELNKLQHEYELSIMVASGYTSTNNDSLKEQLELQKTLLEQQYTLKNSYANDKQEIINKYGKKYSKYFQKDSAGNIIGLNEQAWRNKDGKISTDSATAKALDKIYELWSDAESGFEEAEDAIMDIESTLASQREQAYTDFWDLVAETIDMIVEIKEKELEKWDEQIDLEESANQELISTIRSNFAQIRQDRQNEKTEDEISDIAKKIAYLKQDTTGGNATQIKELEKQLAEKQESYTDTLIDQAIDAEEQINENNIEYQRNMQEYAKAQLDWEVAHNEYEEEAIKLIQGMLKEDGTIDFENSEWYKKFQELNGDMNTGNMYKKQQEIINTIDYIETYLPDLFKSVTDAINGSKNPDTMNPETTGSEVDKTKTDGITDKTQGEPGKTPKTITGYMLTLTTGENKTFNTESEAQDEKNKGIYYWQQQVATLKEKYQNSPEGKKVKEVAYNIYLKAIDKLNTFKEATITPVYEAGGLADFTGPAWLDGTKSNPEIVLNAKDSENFIQLRDILRGLFEGVNNTTNNTVGDSYFDIDVNVESIDSSYDLDQIAQDIKYSIYKDASYRNINNISTLK